MQLVPVTTCSRSAPEALVHLGAYVRRTPCEVDVDAGAVGLPPGLLSEWGLEEGQKLHVAIHDGGRHVHLGPVVGMTLDPLTLSRLVTGESERYRNLTREAREVGVILCFFAPDEADCDAGNVLAWVERGGRWVQQTMPLPDVLYHRATYEDPDRRREGRRSLRRMGREWGTAPVNPANSFSKLQVYEALRFFRETAALAPETMPFTGPDALESLMRQHRRVFVKADFGSHGSDVIRITARDGGFLVQGRFGGKEVSEIFAGADQLQAFLGLVRSGTAWVVQQGIDLPEVEDRLFDLRAIAQKDRTGTWRVPLVLVRHAGEGSVAANMALGGTGFLAGEFAERFGGHVADLPDLGGVGAETALRVAAALEARFGLLGEIGVDIGLDRNGQPWIFEANTKPLHPPLPGLPCSLTRYPLEYATHLAKRAWEGRYSGLPVLV